MLRELLLCLSYGFGLVLVAFVVLWPRVARNAVARAWHVLWWVDVVESKEVNGLLLTIEFNERYDIVDRLESDLCLDRMVLTIHGRRARKWWRWVRWS